MKITKKQLRQLIREEYDQLPQAGDPAEAARLKAQRDAATVPDPKAVTDELVAALKKARLGAEVTKQGEVYIMTGGAEGITVKVLRRGR